MTCKIDPRSNLNRLMQLPPALHNMRTIASRSDTRAINNPKPVAMKCLAKNRLAGINYKCKQAPDLQRANNAVFYTRRCEEWNMIRHSIIVVISLTKKQLSNSK